MDMTDDCISAVTCNSMKRHFKCIIAILTTILVVVIALDSQVRIYTEIYWDMLCFTLRPLGMLYVTRISNKKKTLTADVTTCAMRLVQHTII